MENLTFWELVGLIGSSVSIALGLVAMLLSWLFYRSGKQAEMEASKLLIEIKSQTNLLQELNFTQIGKLTDAVLDTPSHLLAAMGLVSNGGALEVASVIENVEESDDESTQCFLNAYNAAYGNILLQLYINQDATTRLVWEATQELVEFADTSYTEAKKWIEKLDELETYHTKTERLKLLKIRNASKIKTEYPLRQI